MRARLRASRLAAGSVGVRDFPRPMGVWAAPHMRTAPSPEAA